MLAAEGNSKDAAGGSIEDAASGSSEEQWNTMTSSPAPTPNDPEPSAGTSGRGRSADRPLNILVIGPHFEPDVAPTGEVLTSIVHELAKRNHRIHVVTSLPWYRHHQVEQGWTGKIERTQATEWGAISRLHPFPTEKSNIPARALAFAGFTGLAIVRSLAIRRRPDVVLAMSPPLPIGTAGWLAARARRAPWVFNIQDVFPDVAIEVGALKSPRVIAAAHFLERFLYERSDAVTVLSADLQDNLRAKVPPRYQDRIRVIPNFVDTERVQPQPRDNSYRSEFGLGDRTVVMYAGNVGLSQPLELLIGAARRFQHRSDVVFVINGGGSSLDDVRGSAVGLDNVVFVPMQDRERLGEVLAAADIHTVLLRSGIAKSSVPSKLYSILAAARPVVASVDPGTEVERTINEAGAGVAVGPEDLDQFCAALEPLLDDPELRSKYGNSGRSWVKQWQSPAMAAREYEKLFRELIEQRSSSGQRSGFVLRRG